jgi:hypothetical protein
VNGRRIGEGGFSCAFIRYGTGGPVKIVAFNNINPRLSQNFSFETAAIDLREKAGIRPLFLKACLKTKRILKQIHPTIKIK